jgi:hypothetical protein
VNGSYNLLPKHSMRVQPGPVDLVLETPIRVAEETGKEAELTLMEQVHTAIEKHYVDQ